MNCPLDGSELNITDRQGIEIDYCPKCRGVWLDRGELDKNIKRTSVQPYSDRDDRPDDRRRDDDGNRGRESDYRPDQRTPVKKKRKRSMLEDLFDFG